ncbi:MAG: LuxR family transcriptional regulator [Alphaproteobacteria bacterium]
MNDILTNLRSALSGAKTLQDLNTIAGRFACAVGYTHHLLLWTRLPPVAPGFIERPERLGTMAPEWLDRFWLRRYHEDDCVISTCLGSTLPVTWSATPSSPLTRRQRRIAREAARFGLAAGVAVPVRAPAGLFSLFIVAKFREPDDEPLRGVLDVLSLGAIEIVATLVRVIPPPVVGPSLPRLKPIECECLLWAARGYSTEKIAKILGLRPRTVVFHLGNAMGALGASSRIQAVAIALHSGLITPYPFHSGG